MTVEVSVNVNYIVSHARGNCESQSYCNTVLNTHTTF